MTTNQVVDYIYQAHGQRATQWNNQLLDPGTLQVYANDIRGAGAPLELCFGFIDGNVRPISKPKENQSTVYNGHKLVHAFKFQSVAIRGGLISNLHRPVGEHAFYYLHEDMIVAVLLSIAIIIINIIIIVIIKRRSNIFKEKFSNPTITTSLK